MPRFTRVILGGVDISEFVTDVAVATEPMDVDVTSVMSAFRTAVPAYQHTVSVGARNLRGLINALHQRAAEERAEEFRGRFFENTRGMQGMRADYSVADEAFTHSPMAEDLQQALDRAWRERNERRARLQPGEFISDSGRVCAPLPEHVIDQDTIDQGLTFTPRPSPRDEGYVTWHGDNDAHTWSAKHAFSQNIPDLPAKLCEHCGMWPDHHDHHTAGWSGEKCVCQECDPEGDLHNPTSMYNE